jgi:hypothetical protein
MKTEKKPVFILRSFALTFILSLVFLNLSARDFYQIKVYTFKDDTQQITVEKYLKDAYLPALHKAGIKKVGVFKPIEADTANFGKKLFVLIPFKDLGDFDEIEKAVNEDAKFEKAGTDYINAPFDNPPYIRIESILLKAFKSQPDFFVPKFRTPKSEQIFELRSYQSSTEKIHNKKVEMFNEGGETGIFKKIGANAIFYGKVLAGSEMPNLMYMTSYENMKANEDCWKAFRDHPDWKRLSGMEEYKNTVSKITKYMLFPADYSDF